MNKDVVRKMRMLYFYMFLQLFVSGGCPAYVFGSQQHFYYMTNRLPLSYKASVPYDSGNVLNGWASQLCSVTSLCRLAAMMSVCLTVAERRATAARARASHGPKRHQSYPDSSCRRWGRQGNLGQEGGLPAVCDRLRCGSGQRVAFPLPVLQERRRWV